MRRALATAAVLLALGAMPAGAQSTGSIAPASSVVPPPWSGESGGSGHAQMTAEAIRADAANFQHCLAGLWPAAHRRHISQATFTQATKGLTPDLRIMDLLDNQPEFTKSFWDYLDILVTEDRIEKGKALIAQHSAIWPATAGRERVPIHEHGVPEPHAPQQGRIDRVQDLDPMSVDALL